MIYELNHLGIAVKNLESSLNFYTNVLGAQVVFKGVIPSTSTDFCYLQIADSMIELLYARSPGPDERYGPTHIAFLTDDLDGDFHKLVEAGCAPQVEPRIAGSGVGRLGFLNDPNGARLELIERDLKFRQPRIDHALIKSFDHFSLLARDNESAVRFYGETLGMTPLTTLSVPANHLTISYFDYGTDVLELLHYQESDTNDPIFGHIALRVENVDRALAHLEEIGVTSDGPSRVAGTGMGRVGVIRDPDGFKIELLDRGDVRSL